MTDLKQGQIDYYEGLLSQHGDSYLALDWNSPESQRLRFKIFKEIFVYGKKASGISVLDVGCGFGDFYGFLKAEGVLNRQRISYTGYDITPGVITVAKKKYPDGRFELKDILTERSVPKFDYVFCSGALNIRTTEKDEHFAHVREMVARMFDLSVCGTAINFLSEGSLPAAPADELNAGRYFYFSPDQIVNYARHLTSRFIIRHDYHPGDFTLYLFN